MPLPLMVNGTLTVAAEVPVTVTVKFALPVPASVIAPDSPALRAMAMLSASLAAMDTVAAWSAASEARVTAPPPAPMVGVAPTVTTMLSAASAMLSAVMARVSAAVVWPALTVTEAGAAA